MLLSPTISSERMVKMWVTLSRNPNYAVNEQGEIFSHTKQRKLTPKVNHDGYLRIQLWSGGKCEFVSIHRLIAETFLPNPDMKPFVNHKDGNKRNNTVSNLEWCTQKENISHAWKTGLSHTHLNRAGKQVKQLSRDGRVLAVFPSMMQVERELGINHVCVSHATRKNATAGGYRWEVMAK